MTLTLGTNAYIELATFKAWCDQRGYDYNDKAGYQDSVIEAAIVRSSVDFIDVNYNFKGDSLSDDQPLQLPTNDVTIANIENGAAQAAWQELCGELFVDLSNQSVTGQVKREMKKIDVLETEIEYQDGTAKTNLYSTSRIDRMLAKYVAGGGGLKALRA